VFNKRIPTILGCNGGKMEFMIQVLKKQKQLAEIEANEVRINNVFGYRGIHENSYYKKMEMVVQKLEETIVLLDSVEKDIYSGVRELS